MFNRFRPGHIAWALGLLTMLAAHAGPQEAHDGTPPAAKRRGSAFEHYRPYTDQPVRPWREVNDEVRCIGGWRAYAREAHEAAERPAQDATSAGHHHHD